MTAANTTMALSYSINPFDPAIADSTARELSLHPALARVLIGRGFPSAAAIRAFLNPDAGQMHDPALMPGMEAAVARLCDALDRREKIIVHGDYDVDGLTSTALMLFALRTLKAEVEYYIPNRLDEGYGLKMEGVEFARRAGAALIVTCDCGTSSVDEIAAAAGMGIDVIVTDHHEPDGDLPSAVAVVNPKRPDSRYPFRGLAGVGVTAKLVLALMRARGIDTPLNNILRIACLGTIADVVPLVDENRYIARAGLDSLPGTPNVGLKALFREAGIKEGAAITSYDVGFRIAPRLNAAGRFGKQDLAMELLFERSETRAKQIAGALNRLNQERQQIVETMVREAHEMVAGRPQLASEKLILVGKTGWSKGLVGLVASKLVEAYSRPALVFAEEEGIAQGSGRSVSAFNLVEQLGQCADLFTRFGGHAMAVGFELPMERISELRARLLAQAASIVPDPETIRSWQIDAEAPLDELDDLQLIAQYPLLEPFGYQQEAPLFLARDAELRAAPAVLKEKHLKLSFRRAGRPDLTALAWNFSDRRDQLRPGGRYDLVYALSINSWGDKRELQIVIKDFAPAA